MGQIVAQILVLSQARLGLPPWPVRVALFIEQKIIIEFSRDLIDYEIVENGLKEISHMTVGPEDLLSRLIEDRRGAEAADVQK